MYLCDEINKDYDGILRFNQIKDLEYDFYLLFESVFPLNKFYAIYI